jgi:N-methylhydantoinase A/oxoprolinase/acetone carboxylase beta subunit
MRIAVDVGGTFTDVIVLDEKTNALRLEKVETTPRDPISANLRKMNIQTPAFCADADARLTLGRYGATKSARTVT